MIECLQENLQPDLTDVSLTCFFQGIVGTSGGTLWYINWAERTSIRLVSGHNNKVNALALCDDQYLASCSDDGSLRVWSVNDREQTLQFQVMDQVRISKYVQVARVYRAQGLLQK